MERKETPDVETSRGIRSKMTKTKEKRLSFAGNQLKQIEIVFFLNLRLHLQDGIQGQIVMGLGPGLPVLALPSFPPFLGRQELYVPLGSLVGQIYVKLWTGHCIMVVLVT